MGALILPSRFNQQPQGSARLRGAAPYAYLPAGTTFGPNLGRGGGSVAYAGNSSGIYTKGRGVAFSGGGAMVTLGAPLSLDIGVSAIVVYAPTSPATKGTLVSLVSSIGAVLQYASNSNGGLSVDQQQVTNIFATGDLGIRAGGVYTAGLSYVAGGSMVAALDGRIVSSVTTSVLDGGTISLYIARRANDFSEALTGGVLACIIFDRTLNNAELASYTANPWQLFAAPPRRLVIATSTGGANADLAKTLGAATLATSGALGIAASSSTAFGSATVAASATAAVAAATSSTLGSATLAATGAAALAASTAATLGPATLAATASAALAAALARTLGTATLAAAGTTTLQSNAALAATLGPAGFAATAGLTVGAALATTFGPLAASSTGALPLAAALARTLGSATLASSVGQLRQADLAGQFAPLLLSSAAAAQIAAQVTSALAAASLQAAGVLVPITFIPPPLLRALGLVAVLRRPARKDRIMLLGKFVKQPAEREAYAIEYEDDLAPGDTLVADPAPTITITAIGTRLDTAPLALVALDVAATRATVWLGAGTELLSYKITVTAATTAGRILQDEFVLKIKDY